MNRIVSLILSTIFTTSLGSARASQLHDMDAVQDFLKDYPQYTSLPASRLFSTTLKRTAAGVFHYAQDEKGVAVILLGLRDDNNTFCNLGGMSNENEVEVLDAPLIQSLLSKTASREVMEESNGYYAHHPSDLERQPFIDVLANQPNKGALLYRMYLKKVKKVDAAILLKASEEAHHSHNQEFLEFIWAPVEEILGAVKKQCNSFILEGKPLSLFEPLFATLSTPSGVAFLNAIHAKGIISFLDRSLRALHNRLYVVNDTVEKSMSLGNQVRWVLPEMRLEKPSTELQYLDTLTPEGKRHTLRTYVVPAIPFGQNAWGQTSQVIRLDDQSYTTNLSAVHHHKIFCDAVAAHSAAMVELKHKYPQAVELPELTAPAKWNAKNPLTITRIHLRFVLGPDYKYAIDFVAESNPQRAADIENLRNYLSRYNQNSDDKDGSKAEFRRKIEFNDHDLNMFADILAWESEHQATPVFYHAATAELNNLWHSFTHVRELITLKPFVGRNVVVRGTDLYFRGVKSMPDMINSMGKHDYENGKANKVLSANYVMTAGLATTRSTSSSVEYQLNDHSVNAPDSEAKFDEAMSLAGIIADYAYFRSAFLQFLAHRHPAKENSVMLGISIPEVLLQDNSCTDSHRRAYPDGASVEDGQVISVNANHVYPAIQKEYESQKDVAQPFEVRRKAKRELIPEARLSLHPTFIHHPAVRIQAFSRFPIDQREQRLFNQEVRNATIGTMSDWLQSQQQVMPDSFEEYPAIKRLFKAAYKAMTGQDSAERLATRGLKHLINNGHLEAVREFLELNPDLVDRDDFPLIDMSHQAIRAGNMDVLKYLCEEFGATSAQEFYKDQDGYLTAIRCCLLARSDMCLVYLFAHCKPAAMPQSSVDSLLSYIRSDDHEFGKLLSSYFPSLKKRIIGLLFEKDIQEYYLDDFIGQGCSPEELFYELTKDNQGKNPNYLRDKELFSVLANHHADLTKINPETHESYIFGLRYFDSALIGSYAKEFRERLPEMLLCRDRSGRDIIHHAQESMDKKEKNALLRLLVISVGNFSTYMTDEQMGNHILGKLWKHEFLTALDNGNTGAIAQLAYFDMADLDLYDGMGVRYKKYENNPTLLKRFKAMEKKSEIFAKMKNKLSDALKSADLRTIYWFVKNRPSAFLTIDIRHMEMPDFLLKVGFLEEDDESLYANKKLDQIIRERAKVEAALNSNTAILSSIKASRGKKRLVTAKVAALERAIDETKSELAKLSKQQTVQEQLNKEDLSYVRQALEEIFVCGAYPNEYLNKLKTKLNDPTMARYLVGGMLSIPQVQVKQDFLEIAFPHRDDFLALTTTTFNFVHAASFNVLYSLRYNQEVFINQSPFELACSERMQSAIDAIAAYMGDRLYELLARMDDKTFGRALVYLQKAKVRELYEQHPNLFVTSEAGRDFLGSSLNCLPDDLKEDLVHKNFSNLFARTPRTGTPYFWQIAYTNCRKGDGALTKKLIERDPKLLELRSADGMTIADYAKLTGTEKVIEKVLKYMNRG